MRMKPELMIITATALMVGLTGCGSSATTEGSNANGTASQTSSSSLTAPSTSPDAAPSAATEPVLITIKDFKYSIPASVAPGAKITVRNQDDQNHTVTSATKGAFDVTVNGGGGTATFTAPAKPGSYTFVCTFHANMTGTLVVK